jgi:uncharacterized protein (TIRG00374 family)
MKKAFLLFRVMGLLLFAYLVTKIDWGQVWAISKNIHLGYIFAYMFIFVIIVLLQVFRLHYFLGKIGFAGNISNIYQAIVMSAFYGYITPARTGEFSKVLYLLNYGLCKKYAWLVVMLEKMVSLSVFLAFSVIGVVYFFVLQQQMELACGVMLLVVFALLCIVFYHITSIFNFFAEYCGRKFPALFSLVDFIPASKKIGEGVVQIFMPTSVFILLLSFMQLKLVGHALNISVPFLYLSLSYVVSSIIALLPISIAGLGTREMVYIKLLEAYGVLPEQAVAISLMDGLILPILAQSFFMLPMLFRLLRDKIYE